MSYVPKILIVDDKEENLVALQKVLKETEAQVVQATNGNDALKTTLNNEFALAILDVQMPGMDGYELAELLRGEEKTANIPIMFLSAAYSDEPNIFKGYEAGAVDFIGKPYNPKILLTKVDVFLRLDRLRLDEIESLARFPAEDPNPVLRVSANGSILYANDASRPFLDIWGCQTGEPVSGPLREEALDSISSGKPAQVELECDGLFLSVTIAPVQDADYVNLYALDITDLKNAEKSLRSKTEEVQTMSEQLWQSSKLATMGELSASIAHELNNPLATVSLLVESLMLNADEGDPSLDTLNTIEQETERMANLVGNLLEFSRRGTRQVSSLDVREELQNSLELIHYHLKKRNVTVVKEFDENVKMVHADRQQLRQVFLNVMANASDALDGAGKITIRAGEGTLDDKRAAIVIEIEDTGPGISPEVLSKAMDPFFTTKEAGKGTGLGLPICKRIIEEHEGDFTISSEVGKGTTVRIGLPVQNGKNAEQLDCDY